MFIKNKANNVSIYMGKPQLPLQISLLHTPQYLICFVLLCQLPPSSLITEFQDFKILV